jgi:hypothetical protein
VMNYVSAVFLVCKQNNARLNLDSLAAQVAPPLLRTLTSNSLLSKFR